MREVEDLTTLPTDSCGCTDCECWFREDCVVRGCGCCCDGETGQGYEPCSEEDSGARESGLL